MKRFSVVLVALAVIIFSQNAFSEQRVKTKPVGRSFETNNGETPLETPSAWRPFLPNDVVYSEADHIGGSCDKDGNYITQNTIHRCKKVHSPRTGEHFRIRKSPEGSHIFVMKKNTPVSYVQFEGGGTIEGDRREIVYISPKAQRFAENNGYVLDKRNNTMIAKGSSKDDTQVAEQPKSSEDVAKNEDCASKGSTLEKAKCIGEQSGAIGAVIKGLPKF